MRMPDLERRLHAIRTELQSGMTALIGKDYTEAARALLVKGKLLGELITDTGGFAIGKT